MAKEKPSKRTPTLRLEGLKDTDRRPDIQVAVYDEGGECINIVPVKDDGTYSISAAVRKKASKYVFGPANEEALDVGYTLRADTLVELERSGAVVVGRAIWESWIGFLRCATGSVRRCWPGPWWFAELAEFAARVPILPRERLSGAATARADRVRRRIAGNSMLLTADAARTPSFDARVSPVGSLDELLAWPFRCAPVCDAKVEVWRRTCCCDPWIIDDPRLPELIDWLDDLVPEPVPPDPPLPYPPFPEPEPPFPQPKPGPDPVPFAGTSEPDPGFVKGGALDEASIHAAQDLHALETLPADRVPEYVNARPYLLCGRYSCSAPVKVGEGTLNPDGRFNVCWLDFRRPLAKRCHDRYAYVVKQRYLFFEITIYDGRSAGQWYDLDDDPTLTSYHSLARTCRHNHPEAFVWLNYVGNTGAWDLQTPAADSAVSVATPGPNSGLVSPNGATGFNGNRNWGRTLAINLMIGEGMKGVGARYYRLSVTRANASGDPVGPRHDIDIPVSWKKAVPDGSGGVDVVPVVLGPQTVGGQNALYTIPYDSDGDWDDGQFHAFLDTQDSRWNDPNVRHLVTIEIFDQNGKRLRPQGTPATGLGGTEGTAAFTYRRRYQDLGPTAEVPFGALTHMFWWDNREVFGSINQLIRSGLVFNQECLFLGGEPDSTFGVGYRAFHPNERFQRYHNIWWKRGLGSTPGNTGFLEY